MDVVKFLCERRDDIAAFTSLLFQSSSCSTENVDVQSPSKSADVQCSLSSSIKHSVEKSGEADRWLPTGTPSRSCSPLYRRPSSSNVPVSWVVHAARDYATKQRRLASRSGSSASIGGHGASVSGQSQRDLTYLWMQQQVESRAAKVGRSAVVDATSMKDRLRKLRIKRQHQRVLTPAQWVLLLKRRRRLWQRRRPIARRRHVQRQLALRYGRQLPQSCSCSCICSGMKKKNSESATQTLKIDSARRKEGRKSKAATVAAPAVTQWLPSHARLGKRFLPARIVLHVQRGVAHTGSKLQVRQEGVSLSTRNLVRQSQLTRVASIAVASDCMRKHHRRLQRWATELSRLHGHPDPNQGKKKSHMRNAASRVPTEALLADLSHHCVYTVEPWFSHTAVSAAPPSINLLQIASMLFLSPAPHCPTSCNPSEKAVEPTWGLSFSSDRQRNGVVQSNEVLHGFMWTAGGRQEHEGYGNGNALVVPVILVDLGSTPSLAFRYLLFSEAPVLLRRRSLESYRIQLISLWNTCSGMTTFAATWEYWCPEASKPSTPNEEAPKSAAQRPAAALPTSFAFHRCCQLLRRNATRLRRAGRRCASPITTADAIRSSEKRSTKRQTARLQLLLLPSLSTNIMQTQTANGDIPQPYAWRMCLILSRTNTSSHGTAKPPESPFFAAGEPASLSAHADKAVRPPMQPTTAHAPPSCALRRLHYRCARLFFGHLITKSRCCAIGVKDRSALLHLVGQPAYPLDYGESRPSFKRSSEGQSATSTSCSLLARAYGGNSCSIPHLSYKRTLEMYANPRNAGFRLFVRASCSDRKLPKLHGSVGSLLLQVSKGGAAVSLGMSEVGAVSLLRTGVVTSGPFFSQRFGCLLTTVWCCFPQALHLFVEGMAPGTRWVLVPRETAVTLLQLSQQCKSAEESDTGDDSGPSLKRVRGEEHQQGCATAKQRRRLARTGRTLRQRGRNAEQLLMSQMLDPTLCTFVEVIQWYQ